MREALIGLLEPTKEESGHSAQTVTRQDAAPKFLLELVCSDSIDAEAAIEALVRSAPSEETMRRLEKAVSGNPRLSRALAKFQGQ